MMTFKDLKKLVELPSYKEQRVPTVKALEVSGVPVVTEKVLENHGSIKVYQNGYVIYRAHKRVTVFLSATVYIINMMQQKGRDITLRKQSLMTTSGTSGLFWKARIGFL